MSTVIHKWVEQCEAGTNPRLIARVASGWVLLGESQFLRGYTLLVPSQVVGDLNALKGSDRVQFLSDYANIGDVLLEVTDAVRVNYEILGNQEPALHAHLFPRYSDEAVELCTKPVWFYDWEAGPAFQLERDKQLMASIAAGLHERGLIID